MVSPLRDASILTRALAFLLDVIPITAALATLAWVLWPAFSEAFRLRLQFPDDPEVRVHFLWVRNTVRDASMGVYVIGAALAEFGFGATPGKMALGLRTVDAEGNPLTPAAAFARNVSKTISLGCCWIGLAWMLVDRDGRTLHDRLAGGTRVVRG